MRPFQWVQSPPSLRLKHHCVAAEFSLAVAFKVYTPVERWCLTFLCWSLAVDVSVLLSRSLQCCFGHFKDGACREIFSVGVSGVIRGSEFGDGYSLMLI